MTRIVLDANVVIMHGRAFPGRVRARIHPDDQIILPEAVKQELVDDVLDADDAPDNHRRSAQAIQTLIDDVTAVLRERRQ